VRTSGDEVKLPFRNVGEYARAGKVILTGERVGLLSCDSMNRAYYPYKSVSLIDGEVPVHQLKSIDLGKALISLRSVQHLFGCKTVGLFEVVDRTLRFAQHDQIMCCIGHLYPQIARRLRRLCAMRQDYLLSRPAIAKVQRIGVALPFIGRVDTSVNCRCAAKLAGRIRYAINLT
jgi:hypothetical protein